MIAGFLALAPVAMIIALGWGLKRAGFPGDGFWAPAERLTYYLFMPGLIIGGLARASADIATVAPMIATLILSLLLAGAAMLALRRALTDDGPAFTSLFQGAVRANIYAGIACATALYGETGLTLAAVAVAAVVPTVNLMSVAVLSRYAAEKPADWAAVLAAMARNPMIIACALGALLNLTGIGAPGIVGGLFDILGPAALAVGLLCLGAGLSFDRLGRYRGGIAASCAVKLLVLPGLVALGGAAFGVSGASLGVVILFAASPAASSAFILSRQMGGDSTLMAQTVALSTLAAAVTLPVALAIFT